MALKDEFLQATLNDAKKFHSVSMDDTLETTVNKILDGAKTSVALNDHYNNTLTSTGTADKVSSFSNYGFSNDTLNWPLWLALYNDSWVFRRAIDKPAQDEINCGITIHGDQDYTKAYRAYNRNKSDLIKILMWGALFGGSVGVMIFDGVSDEEMKSPISKNKVHGKRMRLYVTDRWYGLSDDGDTVSDMRDIDFGKPKMYWVTYANGKRVQVHHSWVLRYEHRTAPQLIKNGQLMGWGYAEGAHILNELSRDDQLKADITSLINKSLIEVIKMSGMRGVFMGTDKGNEEQLRKRLEMVNWGRNFNSLTFLDKDDVYEQHQMGALSGLSDLMEKNMWLISAALEMQGILYGDLKGGLSQESDALRRYAITIQNRCDAYVRPVIQKFLMVQFMIYDISGPVDFDFNSLVKDDLNKDKMTATESYARLLEKFISMGIFSKYQAAVSIMNFMNKDIIDVQFTEENLNTLKLEEEYQTLETIKGLGKSKQPSTGLAGTIGSGGFSSEDFGSLNPTEEYGGEELNTSNESPNMDLNEEPQGEEVSGEQE